MKLHAHVKVAAIVQWAAKKASKLIMGVKIRPVFVGNPTLPEEVGGEAGELGDESDTELEFPPDVLFVAEWLI